MTYPWTDNPTLSGVAQCDTDVLNDCLMYLKYNNATRNIGEIVQSTIPLTDAGLHLLDGSLISGSGSYSTFVDYIISLYYNNASIYYKWEATFNSTTYTTYTRVKNPTTDDYYYSTYGTTQIQRFAEYNVGNITWQVDGSGTIYYATSEATLVGTGLIGNVTPTPPSYFETEVNWQQSVTDYGVCGKFVYDSVNNTVRLPKITGILNGTTDATALGDLVEQYVKLPNITADSTVGYGVQSGSPTHSGASNITGSTTCYTTVINGSDSRLKTGAFDASKSSSVYSGNGTDTKIQPQAIKALYYIVIATSTKTDIQVDIDELATDLNGKADVDLTNINNTGKIAIAHNAMPSNTYELLTVGANGTSYTAPADGWYSIYAYWTNNAGYMRLDNGYYLMPYAQAGHTDGSCQIQVKKGQQITLYYNYVNIQWLVFIYAVGSESEAQ